MAQNPYKTTVNSFSFKSDPALVYMKYVHIVQVKELFLSACEWKNNAISYQFRTVLHVLWLKLLNLLISHLSYKISALVQD